MCTPHAEPSPITWARPTRAPSTWRTPACSYAWAAALRVSVLTLGRIWQASSHGSVVSTDAEIFTARRRCSADSFLSLAPLTTTAAAAPSQLAEHMGLVLG